MYFFAILWEVRITNVTFLKSSFLHALSNILHTSYFPVPEAIWSGVSPLFFMKILFTWFASRISRCSQNALQTYIRIFICMSSFMFLHNILSCKMFCHNINIQMVFYFFEFFRASLCSNCLQISCHNINMHVFEPVKSWIGSYSSSFFLQLKIL